MSSILNLIPGLCRSSKILSCSAGGKWRASEEDGEESDGDIASTSTHVSTGSSAHSFFCADAVRPWDAGRFHLIKKLEDSKRNHGEVVLMRDELSQKMVAVKQVPIDWACENHRDFVRKHPSEPEMIWVDIGCEAFLNRVSFPYACKMLGVYRDNASGGGTLCMVSEFADGGDLFSWCQAGGGLPPPGPEREELVRPVARQIFDALRRIHDLGIAHGDVSLENLLLDSSHSPSTPVSSPSAPSAHPVPHVKLIDFGRSSFRYRFRSGGVAKPSYKAPEMHEDHDYDGYLVDAFAAGVVLYALLVQDYPWLSTEKGADKAFDFYTQKGLRALLARKKPFRGQVSALSDEAIELLEGLLAVDPEQRLALGDGEGIHATRSSVWNSKWLNC